MITQFEPIARGTYAAGNARANNPQQYQENAYRMLEQYDFCTNCPESTVLPDFQNTAEYKSYWDAVLWLLALTVFFRALMVLILYF